jgi:hypothetical protein
MSTTNFFSSFQVAKPELTLMQAGDHVSRISSVRMTDADHQLDGVPKKEQKPWVDVHHQMAVTFASVKGAGLITNRFNSKGFERYDELTDEQRASGKFENVEGFACRKNKQGQLERCESVSRTTECINILNKFAAALGIAEGESLMDGIQRAIAEKRELVVLVKADVYKDKDQLVVKGFKKVVDASSEADSEYSA